MALSDYDLLAIDEKGNSTNGVFESPMGVKVVLYKNWVYVRDEKAWESNPGSFSEPTEMQIWEGQLSYKDTSIAVKEVEDGIRCVIAWSREWDMENSRFKDLTAMVGVCRYGWEDDRWVGVTPDNVNQLQDMLRSLSEESVVYCPEEVSGLSHHLDKAQRCNQGDMFFAENVPGLGLAASAPGEAEKPLLVQALENVTKE